MLGIAQLRPADPGTRILMDVRGSLWIFWDGEAESRSSYLLLRSLDMP